MGWTHHRGQPPRAIQHRVATAPWSVDATSSPTRRHHPAIVSTGAAAPARAVGSGLCCCSPCTTICDRFKAATSSATPKRAGQLSLRMSDANSRRIPPESVALETGRSFYPLIPTFSPGGEGVGGGETGATLRWLRCLHISVRDTTVAERNASSSRGGRTG